MRKTKGSSSERILLIGLWMIACSLVLLVVYLGWRVKNKATAEASASSATETTGVVLTPTPVVLSVDLPEFDEGNIPLSISRRLTMHTTIPDRPSQEVVEYTVERGDSVFSIAKLYNIKPETVLWANYDQLKDSPDMLTPGMKLKIPPINGVYYEWQKSDTLQSVANAFGSSVEDIIGWTGNQLDLTDPTVAAGTWVMIPDGHRAFKTWFVPQIARGKAGVSKSVYGPGACEGSYDGAYGTGGFIWPSANHYLSGNDFWSGHLGIDIAGGLGDAVFASDSGVIVFAGWSTGGYGNMIMIDHGNGYQTVYGHLSKVNVGCGQSVYQGNYIGAIGSTGNSTGAHLHFEIRLNGQFVDPWYVLP